MEICAKVEKLIYNTYNTFMVFTILLKTRKWVLGCKIASFKVEAATAMMSYLSYKEDKVLFF